MSFGQNYLKENQEIRKTSHLENKENIYMTEKNTFYFNTKRRFQVLFEFKNLKIPPHFQLNIPPRIF